jgi:hypothetical protein
MTKIRAQELFFSFAYQHGTWFYNSMNNGLFTEDTGDRVADPDPHHFEKLDPYPH